MSERDPLIADRDGRAETRDDIFIKPTGDVLSVFFFLTPLVKRRKEDSATYRHSMVGFSFTLLVLSICMQLTLLWVVGNAMVEEKESWMSDLVTVKVKDVSPFKMDKVLVGTHYASGCRAKYSLCFEDEGMITCAPKTIQLMGRWSNIDLNGDGVFSFAEANDPTYREKTRCRLGVDPLVFYRFVLQQLRSSQVLHEFKLLHNNITSGHAIHKAYFDWLKGDAILCSYGADDMCGNIFQMGVFDAPLKYPGISRIINDAASGAIYCRELLREEGRCEQMLPSTYRVWRNQQSTQCGAPSYAQYLYTNPRDSEDVVSLAEVDFETEVDYYRTSSWQFAVFLTVIIISFLANTLHDLRRAFRFAIWTYYFPDRALPGEEGFEEETSDENTLLGISANHRRLCTLVLVVNIVMTILVAWVGIIFLTSGVSYKDLLFDALSLALITQMDQILYEMLVRAQAKEELENITPMVVTIPRGNIGHYWLRISPPIRDFFWTFVLIFVSAWFVYEDYQTRLIPVRKALSCACSTEGDKCFEAQLYNKEWWDDYWRIEVPGAYETLHRLMGHETPATTHSHHGHHMLHVHLGDAGTAEHNHDGHVHLLNKPPHHH